MRPRRGCIGLPQARSKRLQRWHIGLTLFLGLFGGAARVVGSVAVSALPTAPGAAAREVVSGQAQSIVGLCQQAQPAIRGQLPRIKCDHAARYEKIWHRRASWYW